MTSHKDNIVDQFTRQAVPFSTAAAIRDEAALDLILDASAADRDDEVLDVACGPGIVACAFARRCRRVTGIDLTPAMLDRARELAHEQGIENVAWRHGDVEPLPFADGSFSIVVSRFAFHHLEKPLAVLAEMRRVCRPRGRVVVVDLQASADPIKARAFHEMEILRDPSHARALPLDELRDLFRQAALPAPTETFYEMRVDLDGYLERAFPAPGDEGRIRRMFEEALPDDGFGLRLRRRGDRILFDLPIAILVSVIPEG